ncbi:monooxygenase 2-like [Solanum lycopersicum]|uniref:monooxygenase 2-like n=1 Tax=Solanum lycopersicum TaxID=4081 RepID=UPI003747D71C
MTPDFGQGVCSALEDSVVIAKCLGEAFIKPITEQENDESMKIRKGLEKYAKERRWRNFTFISAAYLSGFIQESDNKIISQYFLAGVTISVTLRIANFN